MQKTVLFGVLVAGFSTFAMAKPVNHAELEREMKRYPAQSVEQCESRLGLKSPLAGRAQGADTTPAEVKQIHEYRVQMYKCLNDGHQKVAHTPTYKSTKEHIE